MGIVNVTPDSFSDGGETATHEAAIERGRRMIDDGAAILDVGGESTRPGAEPVPLEEECARVLPVVRALARLAVPVSIDTMKPEVARRALLEGAAIVNDVAGLSDPRMVEVVAGAGAGAVIMHMRGEPRTMQRDPRYDGDVVACVGAYLEERAREAVARGVSEDAIALDPGFGFGKSLEHNASLLGRIGEIASLGRPVVVGVSRKSMLGSWSGRPPGERLAAGIGAAVVAVLGGARVVRTHDVQETSDALAVASAALSGR